MARQPQLLDQWGRPVERAALARPAGGGVTSGLTGVRSPLSGYPADGLTPVRLAGILRDADAGNPVRFLELAEAIEERDGHYLGVLGTRRRSVAQIDVAVEAASEDPADLEKADRIRAWLRRDELQDELFDILDAIGKGYSATRIDWVVSMGQWEPVRLVREDPRWFRFDRETLSQPLALDAHGVEAPLEPFRYVFAEMRAKSGLTLRSGLARVAAWAWMFKAYTLRDWAIFSQTYGQPLRVGKYGPGASEDDRDTLFRAVANIAGDCAAIIPESMAIDFVESGNLGAASDLYERRADWFDRQVSKAVLGQTTTTDAVSGGHAVAKEHRLVQEDIERSDARALAAILNRDLIRPWVQLEWGPQPRYPRLVIARPEAEDLKLLAESVGTLVPLGLRVSQREIRDKLGLSEPKPDEEILRPGPAPVAPGDPREDGAGDAAHDATRASGHSNGGLTGHQGGGRTSGALHAQGASTALPGARSPTGNPDDPVELLAVQLAAEADPAVAGMIDRVEAMLAAAGSLGEFRAMLLAGFPDLDAGPLARVLAQAMLAGQLAGREAVEDEAGREG
jgi:phage gp29-like protein